MTISAFRLAGGVDLSSSLKLSLLPKQQQQQHPLPSELVTKITRAFLDGIYAILDGMVLLATTDEPIIVIIPKAEQPRSSGSNSIIMDGASREDLNPLGVLDLKDSVCFTLILSLI